MGCCRKIKNIVIGYTTLAIGVKHEFTDTRVGVCQECDYSTWMSMGEYEAWLARYSIEVLANFVQLEKLPMLPKQEKRRARRGIYCRICKCYIPAKARVAEEKCPRGKWD